MAIYLAGRYGRREELCGYRAELVAAGIEVTANWLDGPAQRHIDGTVLTPTEEQLVEIGADTPETVAISGKCAWQDVDDVLNATTLVAFTEHPASLNRGRGGRHVEYGMAIAAGIEVIVCGWREHIFHSLPQVIHFATWP